MNNINKLIFLDIDGVLNNTTWFNWCYKHPEFEKEGGDRNINPDCVKKINDICYKTGAYIVLSSSWRLWSFEVTINNLKAYRDLKPILNKFVGITPRNEESYFSRGEEITYFLNCCRKRNFYTVDGNQLVDKKYSFNQFPKYVIIDDDNDFLYNQVSFFIKTDFENGITDKDVESAIKILNEND